MLAGLRPAQAAAMSAPSQPLVVLAVGKPPRPGTLVAEVAERMQRAGVLVELRLPHEDPDALRGPAAPDLLVHRGLRPDALAAVTDLEDRGVSCCNPARACAGLADRSTVVRRLGEAGVPVPDSTTAATWTQVQAELTRGPRVVKAARDATGRSARVVLLTGPVDRPPFDGPWLVQEAVASDGVDRKLYVTGAHVRGLLKPALGVPVDAARAPERLDPDDGLTVLARAAGAALGLHLYGVDVLLGPGGPVVVDVNAGPGYRGVAGAAEDVAAHLLAHLVDGRVAAVGRDVATGPTVGGCASAGAREQAAQATAPTGGPGRGPAPRRRGAGPAGS